MTETASTAGDIRATAAEPGVAGPDPGAVPGDAPRAYSSVLRLRADAGATVADVAGRLSVGSIPAAELDDRQPARSKEHQTWL